MADSMSRLGEFSSGHVEYGLRKLISQAVRDVSDWLAGGGHTLCPGGMPGGKGGGADAAAACLLQMWWLRAPAFPAGLLQLQMHEGAEPLTCSKSNICICLLAAIAEVLSIAWHVRLQPT